MMNSVSLHILVGLFCVLDWRLPVVPYSARLNTTQTLRLPLLLSFCQALTATPQFVPRLHFCHSPHQPTFFLVIHLSASSSSFPTFLFSQIKNSTIFFFSADLILQHCDSSLVTFSLSQPIFPPKISASSSPPSPASPLLYTPLPPSAALFAPVYLHCSSRWFVLKL